MESVMAHHRLHQHQEQPVNLALGDLSRPAEEIGRCSVPGPVRVELTKANLWREFHREGTEMIITKSGRNLFPKLKVRLLDLQPNEQYTVVLEMRLSVPRRFKYSNNRWVDAGEADPQFDEHRTYVQTVMPNKNATWCDVDLKNAKISNSTVEGKGNIVLTSMHKYIPYLHVIRGVDMKGAYAASSLPVTTVFFPETEFVAVTAYQNDAITRKKIENNPFAKGFRETGKAKCRRNQRASPTAVLQGAKEALQALVMQDARRDDAASPMSSASSTTSSGCSAPHQADSARGDAYEAFAGLPTPPSSRTPTPPLRQSSSFGIDDILSDRYTSKRSFSTSSSAATTSAAAVPVHPLYHLVYPSMAVPSWMAYQPFYPATLGHPGLAHPRLAAEAAFSYSMAYKPEYF